MNDRYMYIYGRHTVAEALQFRPDTIAMVWVRDDVRDLFDRELISRAPQVAYWSGKKLPVNLDEGVVHQGVIAKLDRTKLMQSYESFAADLTVTADTCVVVLGELHDPHNVGAIIRSAAAFGVTAVLVPKHRQASVTPAVLKVSVGMGFKLPLVEVGNVNRVLKDLQQRDCFVYGLAGEEAGAVPLPEEQFTKPSVFVVGNEGEGLREKTREHCDTLLAIPMHERCESLNASVSTAIALYAWSAQHPGAVTHRHV
jgi:23S rRNA (guanosine2251-2'-O)-methyltransferase